MINTTEEERNGFEVVDSTDETGMNITAKGMALEEVVKWENYVVDFQSSALATSTEALPAKYTNGQK